ncbi:MAG TPA: DEAD/DEAH box helicase, partial [Anaerolineae bacterium]|nr:DEAD/DEAH box helicase [Anaerolineae bacterium]
MASAFEKLTKILTLEREQGCRDRAVIGGLERFLPLWHREAREETEDPRQVQLIEEIAALLQGYGAKEQEERERIVTEVLDKLAERAPQAPRAPSAPRAREVPGLDLDAPVTRLTGISTAYARRLARLGVTTIQDLLYLVPRRYDDFSALKTINKLVYGEEVTIVGTVWDTKVRETRSGGTVVTTVLSDATGTIQATWFNQPYLARQLRPGRQIVISGRVDMYLGRLTFQSPSWEPLEKELIHTARLVPVYPLTKGLSARWLRRLMKRTVDHWAPRVPEHLPDHVREREGLLDLPTALRQIHFPDNWEMVREARRRLSFDEFLLIQLGVLRQRRNWQKQVGRPMTMDEGLLRAFLDTLPFTLTEAQRRALREILGDLQRSRPMSRLLQGDVGSGKTVVAAAAMLMAVANGYQAVLMAPTEILAEQHYRNVSDLFRNLAPALSEFAVPTIRLLIGSLPRSEKERVHEEIATGEVDIVVGTHALIQEGVSFKDLGFAVIDEQHRFGVTQRAALRQKGYFPHVLVMSATPIPRTLALTVYGD